LPPEGRPPGKEEKTSERMLITGRKYIRKGFFGILSLFGPKGKLTIPAVVWQILRRGDILSLSLARLRRKEPRIRGTRFLVRSVAELVEAGGGLRMTFLPIYYNS